VQTIKDSKVYERSLCSQLFEQVLIAFRIVGVDWQDPLLQLKWRHNT
jgi:hypothetical protein